MAVSIQERPGRVMTAPRLRVALVTPAYPPDRDDVSVASVASVASRLSARGHEVVVATQQPLGTPGTSGPAVEPGDGGVVVRRFATAGSVRGHALSPDLWRWLREGAGGADVVHVHDVHALTSLPALTLAPRPLVLTPRHHPPSGTEGRPGSGQVPATAVRSALARVSRVICSTPAEAGRFASDLGAADRVVTVPPREDEAGVAERCYLELAPCR